MIGRRPSSAANALRDAFSEGRFSDITIDVRSKRLCLHRVVLWQIPFFRSLFEGNWRDSQQEVLVVDVGDPLVTADAFQDVVGTVYNFPVVLTPQNILSIYAAASYLQLEDVCMDCVDFISDHLSTKNAVAYVLFADSYEYMGRQRLTDACMKFLLIHAFDMRDQLSKLPVAFLCELFTSDSLWVPCEFERFNLITDVFENKLHRHRDLVKPTSTVGATGDQQTGDVPPRRRLSPLGVSIQSSNFPKRESEESVRRVLEDILCRSVRYEHLSLEDSRTVAARCYGLGMLPTITALLYGRFKAEELQAKVQSGPQKLPVPDSKRAESYAEDTSCFRFGVELEDAKGLRPEGCWHSDRVFFGGSEWWLVVQRRTRKEGPGHPYGVFLYREAASMEQYLYRDKRTQLGVEAEFVCNSRRHQDKRRKFQNWTYRADWGFWGFIVENELDNYITEKGSLRFMVLLRLVFSSN